MASDLGHKAHRQNTNALKLDDRVAVRRRGRSTKHGDVLPSQRDRDHKKKMPTSPPLVGNRDLLNPDEPPPIWLAGKKDGQMSTCISGLDEDIWPPSSPQARAASPEAAGSTTLLQAAVHLRRHLPLLNRTTSEWLCLITLTGD
jgi:hypothetical protein